MLKNKKLKLICLLILAGAIGTSCLGSGPAKEGRSTGEDLYRLRDTYIGDNSKLLEIVNLLDFPEDLDLDGISLKTDKRPYGLEISLKGEDESIAYYMESSSSYIFRPESLVVFSLVDNLDYIEYRLSSPNLNINDYYMDRDLAENLVDWEFNQNLKTLSSSEKIFKDFYDNRYRISEGIEGLVGNILISGQDLSFRELDLVEWQDQSKVKDLDLMEEDFPNGYLILKKSEEVINYEISNQAIYSFTDSGLLFLQESEGNRLYASSDKEEFLSHLENYGLKGLSLDEQKIPYFIEVKNGKVISISEKFRYSI